MIDKLTIRKANSADATGVSAALTVAFAEYKSSYTQQGFTATKSTSHYLNATDGIQWIVQFLSSATTFSSSRISLRQRGYLFLMSQKVTEQSTNCRRPYSKMS